NPPAAVPQITGADTQSELSAALGASFHCLFLLGHPSPIGHLLRSSVQSRSRNMVSSEAKNGFNCVSCGTFRGGRGEAARHSPKREPRPSVCGQGRGLGNPHREGIKRMFLRFANSRAAAKVPHGTSGTTSP